MATNRQRQIALGVLLVVLAFVLYRAMAYLGQTPATAAVSGRTARAAASGRTAAASATAPDVRLRALDSERPKPIEGERNLFRFKPPPPPPRPAAPTTALATPNAPAAPPPLPPIPLKFIGIVEASAQSKRIAALVDSTGHSFEGREGDVVAGQYRIVKIGVESIEMTYLDGRGRQTIRLSGS
jgi:hypothetical protein